MEGGRIQKVGDSGDGLEDSMMSIEPPAQHNEGIPLLPLLAPRYIAIIVVTDKFYYIVKHPVGVSTPSSLVGNDVGDMLPTCCRHTTSLSANVADMGCLCRQCQHCASVMLHEHARTPFYFI